MNIRRISIPQDRRVICISDIHGSLDLFKKLLFKVGYDERDILILLGDLYLKGAQSHETLKYIIELCKNPDVHAIFGNCDYPAEEYLYAEAWLLDLPHILESEDYIFVHGGICSEDLEAQDVFSCVKNDAFLEKDLSFSKYVITGHWPVNNYCHEIQCCNPIINHERRIIAIDGGNVINRAGQLNAFIISDGSFSFESADDLPVIRVEKAQRESGGTLNITWNDRFVELLERGETMGTYRHIETGKVLTLPNSHIWTDGEGRLCCMMGSDYNLPVEVGDTVSLVERIGDRMLVKKNGVVGWV